jgi:hypothetical protein
LAVAQIDHTPMDVIVVDELRSILEADSIFKIWDYTGSSDFGVLRHAISSFQTAKARQADIMSAALFSPFASE